MSTTTRKYNSAIFFCQSIFLLSTLLLSACFESEKSDAEKSAIHLKQAEAYFSQGQYRAAMIETRNVIQTDPESPAGYLLLAKTFNTLGQSESALQQLNQKPFPDNAEYWFELIRAYIGKAKYQSALKTLKQHEELLSSANEFQFYTYRGNALRGLQRHDEAIESYLQANAIEAENIQTLASLAESYSALNQNHKAFEILQKMEAISPGASETLMFKAGLAIRDGNLDEGESLLTDALASFPSTDIMTPQKAQVLGALASILTKQGRSSEAMIYTRLLADAFPEAQLIQNKFNDAVELFRDSKHKEAQKLLEEILEMTPNFDGANQLLGIIKYTQGNYEEADKYFSGNVDPETSTSTPLQLYALTNLKMNRPDQVLDMLKDTIADTKDPEILAIYGTAALQAGSVDKGLNTFEKALQLDPKNIKILLTLAYIENSRHQQDAALNHLENAYKYHPQSFAAQRSLVVQYLSLKKNSEASALVNDLLKRYSDDYKSYILAGDHARLLGDNSKALAFYKQAGELAPENEQPLVSQGNIYVADLQWDAAQDAFNKALQLNPTNTLVHQNYLRAADARSEVDSAINELTALAAEDTENLADIYISISRYFAAKNDIEKARQYLAKASHDASAVEINKLKSFIAYREGATALSNRDFEKARSSALEGLSLNPNSSQMQIMLAETELQSGKLNEAEKIIQQVKAANPTVGMLLEGDLLTAKKDLKGAINLYNKVWEASPSTAVGRRIFATHSRLGETAKGRSFLDVWERVFPNDPEPLVARGTNLLASGNTTDAIRDLEKAIELRPESPLVMNNLAWAYQSVGNAKAEGLAKRAVQLAPENAAILDTYGWILFKAGKKQEAHTILGKALALAPENMEIKQHHTEVEAAL